MKVYSWNVLFQNKNVDAALAWIARLDFDVLCLQEVPEALLIRLKQLPLHIAYGPDVSRLFPKGAVHDSLVILSNYPIAESASFPVPIPHIPLRTKFFVQLMRPLGWSKIEGKGGLWADVETPMGVIRFFSLHLILANPGTRAHEFELAMQQRGNRAPTIVCGDFNILEAPHITPLSWMLGGSLLDALFWRRERSAMETRFARFGLSNPLRGVRTHPFSNSQLDHILVPQGAKVSLASVLPDPLGSDHHPVCVEAYL